MKSKILWIIGGLGLLVITVIALFSSKKTYFNPMLGSNAARSLAKYDFENKIVTVTFKNGKIVSGYFITDPLYRVSQDLKSVMMTTGRPPGNFSLYEVDDSLDTKKVGKLIGAYSTYEVLKIKNQ